MSTSLPARAVFRDRRRRLATAVAGVSLAAVTLAAASPALAADGCQPIDSLPMSIVEPGLYCLVRDFQTDFVRGMAAIDVQADRVTIDLAGHTIDNTRAGANLAIGVAAWERRHVVVRNGGLAGFHEAVSLSGPFGTDQSQYHLVEGLRISDSIRNGIGLVGNHSIVRGNVVVATGGTFDPKQPRSGIFVGGNGNRVLANDVSRVVGSVVDDVAIHFVTGDNGVAIGNLVSYADVAIVFPPGAVGVYRDNTVSGAPCCQPFRGGTDGGGNLWQ